ncbi:MAG: hypothetical protein IKT03_06745, partial [Muribaculaceae bacterium]|nr:hypothetical protein [Muribaculaceae bacterium]
VQLGAYSACRYQKHYGKNQKFLHVHRSIVLRNILMCCYSSSVQATNLTAKIVQIEFSTKKDNIFYD